MHDATEILAALERGDGSGASEDLLPLVYDELRRLASRRMAVEAAGQTLQPTALVHEAYLRLVDVEQARHWDSRGHFFAAAAEAMRRILIERARGRARQKRGGGRGRIELDAQDLAVTAELDDLLAIDEAIAALEREDGQAARLVRLHYYAGLPIAEAGGLLGLPRSTAYELWTFARASLRVALG